MSDLSSVLIWWFSVLLLGSICLPLTRRIFHRFVDGGYIFSKVLGILLSSWLMWFLGSLHILPFTRMSQMIILVFLAVVNLWVFTKNNSSKRLGWKWIVLEESLFLLTLLFWSYVRATEPSIRGLEKFMDFGFVNSILRTEFFPPRDMWLTQSPDYLGGYFINYYYFGHYVTAFLTKLTGLDSAITYNLAIAKLFAFTFTLSFSLGANLLYLFKISKLSKKESAPDKDTSIIPSLNVSKVQILLAGFLAAFLVSLGGNIHTLYAFTSGYPNEEPVAPWNLSLGFHPDRYWYPNATRFIPFTIHEFPIYSFVVADLHGHVSDIPFVFFAIALLLSLVVGKRSTKNTHSSQVVFLRDEFINRTGVDFPILLLLGILIAVMYMTNAWDGLIYLILSGLVILYLNARNFSFREVLVKTTSASLFLFFFFLVASLPFSLSFKPFASGIGVLCAPFFLLEKSIGPFVFETDKCQRSPIWMMAILWGFFYYNVIGFLVFVILPSLKMRSRNQKLNNNLVGGYGKRIILQINRLVSHISRLPSRLVNLPPVDVFLLILIFVSTLLLVFPEFFYIEDIYPAHYRANTMFKLGYQAFMILGLSSAYIFFRIKKWRRPLSISRLLYKLGFIVVFTLVAIYPYFAISSYYGSLKTYHGLWGLNWLSSQYPDDYEGILWMRENIIGQPVVVEAQGDSYTDYARVSANTGLPTIVGWPVHEWLWRGSYDEAGRRIPEVATVYESTDMQAVKEVLEKYNASYIFVGTLEKEKYPNLRDEKFNQLGKTVFEKGETKIYKLN